MLDNYTSLCGRRFGGLRTNVKKLTFPESFEIGPRIYELNKTGANNNRISDLRELGKAMNGGQGQNMEGQHRRVQECFGELSIPGFHNHILKGENTLFLPVARAGFTLLRHLSTRFPNAQYGMINMQRSEETAEPELLQGNNLRPDLSNDLERIIVLEAMLATGGSAIMTIEETRKVHPNIPIDFYATFTAPQGIYAFQERFRDDENISAYIAQLDEDLNEDAFIVPGIGDAGDMAFGTKNMKQYVINAISRGFKIDYDPIEMMRIMLEDRTFEK